jgi:hypothetical protein
MVNKFYFVLYYIYFTITGNYITLQAVTFEIFHSPSVNKYFNFSTLVAFNGVTGFVETKEVIEVWGQFLHPSQMERWNQLQIPISGRLIRMTNYSMCIILNPQSLCVPLRNLLEPEMKSDNFN